MEIGVNYDKCHNARIVISVIQLQSIRQILKHNLKTGRTILNE